MPSLDTIRRANGQLPDGPPLVAALAGGTTGIGSYVATALAQTFAGHGSRLRVYIIGRNHVRAKQVIAECEQRSPGSDWRFVPVADLALIHDVDEACAEIIRQETESSFHGGPPRVDLLYMSHCYPVLKERTTTSEGLDAFLSTVYYSRVRFIEQLAPLLEASPLAGRAVSIYAGTFEDATDPSELPIGLPPPAKYGLNSVRKHATFMKNFMFEELADKHVGYLSLTHIYPGLVDGPGFYSPDQPLWFRVIWRIMKPLAWLYMTSPEDCGQVMVYLATSKFPAKGAAVSDLNKSELTPSTLGEPGGGCYSLGQRAEAGSKGVSFKKFRRHGLSAEIYKHTTDTLDAIRANNAAS